MTYSQSQAIWELCRQGLQLAAAEAERSWDHGEVFGLDQYLKVPRVIRALIDKCNWEIQAGAHGA